MLLFQQYIIKFNCSHFLAQTTFILRYIIEIMFLSQIYLQFLPIEMPSVVSAPRKRARLRLWKSNIIRCLDIVWKPIKYLFKLLIDYIKLNLLRQRPKPNVHVLVVTVQNHRIEPASLVLLYTNFENVSRSPFLVVGKLNPKQMPQRTNLTYFRLKWDNDIWDIFTYFWYNYFIFVLFLGRHRNLTYPTVLE